MINFTFNRRLSLFCCGLVLVLSTGVYAQKEMDNWIFGKYVNLNFSTGSPVQGPLAPLYTLEGGATMSDASGNLLFYTDGATVWNRNNVAMPNGTGLSGHASCAQNALIIPVPGSTTLFYIFTNDEFSGNRGIQYSIVDITLGSGLGAVTATKNVVLVPGPTTEKLTAVKHCNGTDFWVITRGWNNTQFLAYLVTSAGVSTTPVISNSPLNLTTLSSVSGSPVKVGCMKSSPTGTRVAVFHYWSNAIELAEFDPWTGQFTNIQVLNALPAWKIALTMPGGSTSPYSGDFSPDGKILYTTVSYSSSSTPWNTTLAYQFDVSSMNIAAIEASRYRLDSLQVATPFINDAGGNIQIANNGKLYVGYFAHAALSVINNPNILGAACNYQYDPIPLTGGALCQAGFPNFFPYYANTNSPTSDFTFTGNCDSLNVLFQLSNPPSSVDSVLWSFGDPASGNDNTSRLNAPFHRFGTHGTYSVRLIAYKKATSICHSGPIDTITKQIFIPYLNIGDDTTLCADSLMLPTKGLLYPGGTYLWSTGATTASIAAKQTGQYWLHQDFRGCVAKDTIDVVLDAKPIVDLGDDVNICLSKAPLVLQSTQPAGMQYLWSTGLTGTQIQVSLSGKYWLQVSMNDCIASDTILVAVVPDPVVNIGRDSTICEQIPLTIGTEIPFATYQWNTGENTPFIQVNKTGDYTLDVNLAGCIVSDEVHIDAMAPPALDLGPNGDICEKQTIVLDASYDDGNSYLWNTGATTPTYAATQAGLYSVSVTSAYKCVSTDSILLSYFAKPTMILPNDTTVCEETPLVLKPVYSINEDEVRWSNGSTDRQITITQGDTYIVVATNKCGSTADTINVRQIFCDIWLPNAFTPNGDGTNDVLKVLGNIGRLQDFVLSIYNRWGEEVFITNNKYSGWDGAYKGIDCSLDTYVYMLQYSIDGKPVLQKGNITLIR